MIDRGQEKEKAEADIEADSAVARNGSVQRRFSFGSSVTTLGRQRGPLRSRMPDAAGTPSDASIRDGSASAPSLTGAQRDARGQSL